MKKTQISSVNLGFKDVKDESRAVTPYAERKQIFEKVWEERGKDGILTLRIGDNVLIHLGKEFSTTGKSRYFTTRIAKCEYKEIFGNELGLSGKAGKYDLVASLILDENCNLYATTGTKIQNVLLSKVTIL